MNIEGFDLSNRFKCSDKFEKINNLSINKFELKFYKDQNILKYNLNPIEISKNDSDRVVDVIKYKNHYALTKKLRVFLGDHNKIIKSTRCLNSHTVGNMVMIHKANCENYDKTTISTSPESHLNWRNHIHNIPLYFKI